MRERHTPAAYAVIAVFVAFLAALLVILTPSTASAQYGGISGLFVVTSPERPGTADFNGIGCAGGQTVTLYLPPVPVEFGGTSAEIILGTTTSMTSTDPLLNGSFVFQDVVLPLNLKPGFYEVHARCGSLDLVVLVQLTAEGEVVITPPAPGDAIVNQTPATLSFTGRDASRNLAIGIALIGVGAFLVAGGHRTRQAVALH